MALFFIAVKTVIAGTAIIVGSTVTTLASVLPDATGPVGPASDASGSTVNTATSEIAEATGSAGTASDSVPVVINEFQSSNSTTLADEDGDYPDWIELYNTGPDTIDLGNIGLSDDPDRPFRWAIPAGTRIAPHGYLLIMASGKDRRDPASELHASFRIARDGEPLILTDWQTGATIDSVSAVTVPTDYSYGRYPDGAQHWYYFRQPSPGAPNLNPSYDNYLPPPELSRQGGFYDEAFYLQATSPPGTILRYTLDGSEPGEEDALWPDSLLISTRQSGEPLISLIPTNPLDVPNTGFQWIPPRVTPALATVVRIRAFRDNTLPSPVITHTYFIGFSEGGEHGYPHSTVSNHHPTVTYPLTLAPYPLPVVSLVTDSLHLFDHETGIYIPGKRYEQGHFRPPWGSPFANYFYRGDEWERPASFEFFEPGFGRVMAQDIGIRIHGGMSRALPMKSLRLYARSEYGTNRFDYPFFCHPDAHPLYDDTKCASTGEYPSEWSHPPYNRLILRNSGQDFHRYSTLFRDAMIQGLVSQLDLDTQSYRPVIVFINGEYWGIMNLRERYDRHYLSRTYQIESDRIDYLTGYMRVIDGSNTHFRDYYRYLQEHRDVMDQSVHYDSVRTMLDTDNFIDYNITNIYVNNRDWPANNREYFRYQTAYDPEASPGRDGRWRYLLIDTDYSFGQRNRFDDTYYNMLRIATDATGSAGNNPAWSTLELRVLLENPSFRHDFITRFADYLNTVFSPAHVKPHIRHYEKLLEPVIADHIDRWNYPPSTTAWRSHINVMRYFAENRPGVIRKQLMEHFDLADTVTVTLDIAGDPEGGYIRINRTDLHPSTPGVTDDPWPWSGTYFKDLPVHIQAIPQEGHYFGGWYEFADSFDNPDYTSETLELSLDRDIHLTALFTSNVTRANEQSRLEKPLRFAIGTPYPNPFNHRVTIPYELPETARVSFTVYTLDGRLLFRHDSGKQPAGHHHASFTLEDRASGIYLIQADIRDRQEKFLHREVLRVTLIK